MHHALALCLALTVLLVPTRIYAAVITISDYQSATPVPNISAISKLDGRATFQCPPLLVLTGTVYSEQFGRSVSVIGDINNDGLPDYVIGAPFNWSVGSEAGAAYVISGGDGGIIYSPTGAAAGDHFGYSVAGGGDIDGDGTEDFLIGANFNDAGGSNAGRAYVYSGATGAVIYTLTGAAAGDYFGTSVAIVGDVNGDSYSDFVIGAHGNDGAGSFAGAAYLYSGQTGALLRTMSGSAAGDQFGSSVSGAGDIDGDGHADVIVGAPLYDADSADVGGVYVLSGQTGAVLYSPVGTLPSGQFGFSVSGAGDVDGDGTPDYCVGAPYLAPGGGAFVYSGTDGSLLWSFTAEALGDAFGYDVAGAGDVNADGYDDLIVGAYLSDSGGANAGRSYLFSGKDGARLGTITGEATQDYFGSSVGPAGDLDGDGHNDVIVGAYRSDSNGTDAGRAYVLEWCDPCPNDPDDDIDGDGICGDVDNCPTTPNPAQEDTDSDGLGDVCDPCPNDPNNDIDGDGICGDVDNCPDTSNLAQDDFDADGIGDVCDPCPLDPLDQPNCLTCPPSDVLTYPAFAGAFGFAVSDAGDVNDDGFADVVVGDPNADPDTLDGGRVCVFSGLDGSLIHVFETQNLPFPSYNLGYSVAGAGDIDNDGFDDIVAGAPWRYTNMPCYIRVYSGQTGTLIASTRGDKLNDDFGRALDGGLDLENDGIPNIIVGAPLHFEASPYEARGKVYIYNGTTLAHSITGNPGEQLGSVVEMSDDIDNDGYADFVVGAATFSRVYSGASYNVLYTLPGPLVAAAGDVDGDGYADFLGSGAGSGTYLYAGATGQALHVFSETTSGVAAGDINADGYADVGFGVPDGSGLGKIRVYSGRSRALMREIEGTVSSDGFGSALSKAGDLDGDGRCDIVVGASYGNAAYLFTCNSIIDNDGDGVPDESDNCPAISNPDQLNTDGDQFGDACDLCALDPDNDADGDGFCADVDNCPAVYNLGQDDNDTDGIGDACDPDDDNDGVADAFDNCPSVANAGQENSDGDALGDVCDPDDDNDGITDDVDNCPFAANSSQGDHDLDGIGDVCDPDDDNDGVADESDNCPLTANPGQLDADGDLYGEACDCDDGNLAVHPGATEVCNGLDDDCDGRVDSSAADAPTWYADIDNDGFGRLSPTKTECTQPEGFVANSLDCNDSDSLIYPGAPERCNFIDDDCNNVVDDNPIDTTWYADADDDGYGDPTSTIVQCTCPEGYVRSGTDCDDSNPDVYPGSAENCDNDLDDDCNGTVNDGCCACNCHCDPSQCDGVQDVTDVVIVVNVAFRGAAAVPDPNVNCPYERTDTNCSGSTDVVDVVKIVNVAFRGTNPATEFCNPCP